MKGQVIVIDDEAGILLGSFGFTVGAVTLNKVTRNWIADNSVIKK